MYKVLNNMVPGVTRAIIVFRKSEGVWSPSMGSRRSDLLFWYSDYWKSLSMSAVSAVYWFVVGGIMRKLSILLSTSTGSVAKHK